jgi:hypothetical protein
MSQVSTVATSEVRTQIYLPKKLHRALRRTAKARGVSMAQLLREAAEEVVRRAQEPGPDPFEGLIGTIEQGPADLAENHDHYLYGAVSDEA